jgi:uncharacterized OsmC-like protein
VKTVRVESRDNLRQAIEMGLHELQADEPVASGGDASGPDPYDLLLASLGACTSMTLQLYGRHKGWPLARVVVTLHHDRIHAADCASCETQDGMLDRIRREITLEGALSPEQRERLLAIANRCPIHRTLTSEILIETTLS